MRTFIALIIGVVGGYLLGIALADIIVIDYLPYYLLVIGGILVPLIDWSVRRRKQ